MNEERKEAGFSYVDVMIAVTVLLVGVMAMLSAITSAIVMTTTSQQQLAAKQYSQSTIEAIFSTRDVTPDVLGFDAIGNVGDASIPGGVFLSGDRQFYSTAGPDGIIGTADDAAGADGILGTSDDSPAVDGFTRQITITNVPDPDRPSAAISLRQVDVTISYWLGRSQYRETMTSYVANYRTKD
jgi:Tfp pilus assembly protein PilV